MLPSHFAMVSKILNMDQGKLIFKASVLYELVERVATVALGQEGRHLYPKNRKSEAKYDRMSMRFKM